MNTNLITLREKINEIDHELLKLLEERMKVSEEIGNLKKEEGREVQDKNREEILLNERKAYTSLKDNFVEELFLSIMKESRRIQTEHDP